MTNIVEFLTARLDEDEAGALATTPVLVTGHWKVARDKHADDDAPLQLIQGEYPDDPASEEYSSTEVIAYCAYWQAEAEANLRHIARHDPARVLAEVKAKRALIKIAFDHASKIDGEWGCCHSAESIKAGLCEDERPEDQAILRTLAELYDQHPDYDEAWRID